MAYSLERAISTLRPLLPSTRSYKASRITKPTLSSLVISSEISTRSPLRQRPSISIQTWVFPLFCRDWQLEARAILQWVMNRPGLRSTTKLACMKSYPSGSWPEEYPFSCYRLARIPSFCFSNVNKLILIVRNSKREQWRSINFPIITSKANNSQGNCF
jgi:hypothetical protein